MTRPFGLSRRELAAWTALALLVPLLIWCFRLAAPNTDQVEVKRPDTAVARQPGYVRLDLNKASMEELQLLPGIGPHRAQLIVKHRHQHGRFRAVAELARLPGFSPTLVQRIEPLLTVTPRTPAGTQVPQ